MFFEDVDFIFSSYARHGIAPHIGGLLLVDITKKPKNAHYFSAGRMSLLQKRNIII
jgi:hypothetical protein